MKGKKLLSAVIIILAAVVVCETVYLAAGSGGNGAYEPELSFVGDVEKAVSLRYEEGRYLLSVARTEEDGNGERDAEAAKAEKRSRKRSPATRRNARCIALPLKAESTAACCFPMS